MKKTRIALIAAAVAVVLLTLAYVAITETYLSPAASKAVMCFSLALMEISAVLRIVDDHKAGRPLTAGIVFSVVTAIVAVSGLIEG